MPVSWEILQQIAVPRPGGVMISPVLATASGEGLSSTDGANWEALLNLAASISELACMCFGMVLLITAVRTHREERKPIMQYTTAFQPN
jgi:hypothetical protein